jgi:glycosyltransferase involved in cell wall biosynthesis
MTDLTGNLAPRARVCVLTETYYPVIGGGETQARLLAEGLVDSGFGVIVLTRRSGRAFPRQEQMGPVMVYRLPPAGQGQLKKWGLLLTAFLMLLRLRHEYDLIFVSGFRIVGLGAVLAGKLLKKGCVLKADSRGEMSGEFFRAGLARIGMKPDAFLFAVFLRARNVVLRRADAFVAISDEIAAELVAAGVSHDRTALIPNSVDTRRFAPVSEKKKKALRQALGLPESSIVMTYTGRLVTYKGLPLLLEVWRQLRERYRHITLVLVGSGGLDMHNCEDALKEFVATHHLQESVRFAGGVSNVEEFLQASDAFVFPTEDDAFPSSVVEAMSCGLPIVATPVGAIREMIIDQETGLLIRAGNFEELYESLKLLINNRDCGKTLGQAARDAAHDRYSAASVNRRYVALFCSLLGRAGRVAATLDASR